MNTVGEKRLQEYQIQMGSANLYGTNPTDTFFIRENGMGEDMSYSNIQGEDTSEFLDEINNFLKRQRAKAYARRKGRQQRKLARIGTKSTEAQAQLETAKSLGKSDPSIAAALSAVSQPTPIANSGMSTNTKIGIGVAAVAVVGVVIFLATRKKK